MTDPVVIHKSSSGPGQTLCGKNGYRTTLWTKVTCRDCLSKKRERS